MFFIHVFTDIYDSAFNHDTSQSDSGLCNSISIPISAMSEFNDTPAAILRTTENSGKRS